MKSNYGQKADSLLELKKKGLFPKRLIILDELKSKEDFLNSLTIQGIKDGDELGIRFSSSTKTTNLSRSIVIDSLDKAYEFIKKNISDDLVVIIHDFVFPKYSGTLIKENEKIYLSVVNGAWEAGSAISCDNAIIDSKSLVIWYYPEEKECLFVDKDKLVKKNVKNSEKDVANLFKLIKEKIESLKFEEGILYEFAITPENDFVIMEFKKSGAITDFDFQGVVKDILEIKRIDDLDKWDKKMPLLLSVPISRENDSILFSIIKIIKPFTNKVYVNYGFVRILALY
ncbi:MAG: hypothetical protein ABIH72_01035 [archaeon]